MLGAGRHAHCTHGMQLHARLSARPNKDTPAPTGVRWCCSGGGGGCCWLLHAYNVLHKYCVLHPCRVFAESLQAVCWACKQVHCAPGVGAGASTVAFSIASIMLTHSMGVDGVMPLPPGTRPETGVLIWLLKPSPKEGEHVARSPCWFLVWGVCSDAALPAGAASWSCVALVPEC